MSTAKSHKQRVLVIDDDEVARITVVDYLDEAGFETEQAENGLFGLIAFERSKPDIVLLDVNMPDFDGFTVCECLRAVPTGKHVPILMITGNDDVKSVSRALQVGATDFVTKPVNFELLLHHIKYMLRAKKTEDQLREREKYLAYAQRIARLGNWVLELPGQRFTCSESLCDMFGLDDADVSIESLLRSVHPDDRENVKQNLHLAKTNDSAGMLEFRVETTDRAEIIVRQDIEIVTSPGGEVVRVLGAIQDITERRHAETKIRELAYYDPVTNLPNRILLNELLHQAIGAAQRHKRPLALMFIDLDHFKRINDTWGHTAGDELLKKVAERMSDRLRSCDVVSRSDTTESAEEGLDSTIARIGGDEFVVLLPELRHAEDAAIVAQRINTALKRPFTLMDNEVCVSCSIGISIFPDDGENGDTLLKHADGAMYKAKSAGRNCYHFYTQDIQSRAFSRLSLEASLRQALQRGEFILHYQPKVNIQTGRVVGMEALVRWNSPQSGLVSPAEFIPVAEEIGLIVPLGAWVLKVACAQTAAWHAEGLDELCISVNLSAVQMRQANLAQEVSHALTESGLDAKFLELELTETLLMDDVESHIERLQELKDLGVKLSIDDFGTGYSSLSYLKRFPIDTLKIDRSFIIDIENGPDDAAIVHGVIGLAHSLRLQIVAEGVEDKEQLELLQQYGCDEVQGYFYSRPLPAEEFVERVRNLNSGDGQSDVKNFAA